MKALIIGRTDELLAPLPFLLHRAGFLVDALIPCGSAISASCFINKKHFFKTEADLVNLSMDCLTIAHYDWVIMGDDQSLKTIRDASFSMDLKLKLLPVVSPQFFSHLYSKIYLSKIFAAAKLRTPEFRIVKTQAEAYHAAQELGYPLVVKRDQGGGGNGVFKCQNNLDLEKCLQFLTNETFLMQAFILGQELDISALFLNTRLTHYSKSLVLKTIHLFGPSSVRQYFLDTHKDTALKTELNLLGKALGVHGFANVTCIVCEKTGQYYYIEADLRPTAWVDYPKYYGDDLAQYIQHYFKTNQLLLDDEAHLNLVRSQKKPTQVFALYHRLSFLDLCKNKYRVWSTLPHEEIRMTLRLLWRNKIRHSILRMGKHCLPFHLKQQLRPFFIKINWLAP